MTDEEKHILYENNLMLKAIIKHLANNNRVDDFLMNVAANIISQ